MLRTGATRTPTPPRAWLDLERVPGLNTHRRSARRQSVTFCQARRKAQYAKALFHRGGLTGYHEGCHQRLIQGPSVRLLTRISPRSYE